MINTFRSLVLLLAVLLCVLISHCSYSLPGPSGSPDPSEDLGRGQRSPKDGPKNYHKWRLLRIYPRTDKIAKILLKEVEEQDDKIKVLNVLRTSPSIEVDLALSSTIAELDKVLKSKDLHPLCSLDHIARRGEPLFTDDVDTLVQHRLDNIADVIKAFECPSGTGGGEDYVKGKGKDRKKINIPAVMWLTLMDDLSVHESPTSRQLAGNVELDWRNYHRYDTILRFAKNLAETNKYVGLIEAGKSVQDKELFALVFSTNPEHVVREYTKKVSNASMLLAEGGVRVKGNKNFKERSVNKSTGKEVKRNRSSDKENKKTKKTKVKNRGNNHRKIKGGQESSKNRDSLKNNKKEKRKKKEKKPVIFIDAGTHAREWIGPAVATYLARQFSRSGEGFLKRMNVIIVLLVNPDGYEYSHTTDRLWRKNRRSNPDGTYGVDLNRNWDHEWGNPLGSSSKTYKENYSGPEPFSEPEVRAVRDIAAVYLSQMQLYLTLHSYSQLVMYAWGCSDQPQKDVKLRDMARMLKKKLNTGMMKYRYGKSADLLYYACGTADDYMYNLGVPYSYVIELPNTSSFELPPDKILPTGRSFWSALVCILDEITEERGGKKFCKKRIITVATKNNQTFSSWVSKKIPRAKAKVIVTSRINEGDL